MRDQRNEREPPVLRNVLHQVGDRAQARPRPQKHPGGKSPVFGGGHHDEDQRENSKKRRSKESEAEAKEQNAGRSTSAAGAGGSEKARRGIAFTLCGIMHVYRDLIILLIFFSSQCNIEGKEIVINVFRNEMQRVEREHKEIKNKEERIKFFEFY